MTTANYNHTNIGKIGDSSCKYTEGLLLFHPLQQILSNRKKKISK